MRAYSIFDDYPQEAVQTLSSAGVTVTVHPKGKPRPDNEEMKQILEFYDIVIIGTSQKLYEDSFQNVNTPRIIGTASVGTDHIHIPAEKRELIHVLNAPKANVQSVAEYTLTMMLLCAKRIVESCRLYSEGVVNKHLHEKPIEIFEGSIGVIGAGAISERIIEFASQFQMKIRCWTPHPEYHVALAERLGVQFTSLEALLQESDFISINLPNKRETVNLLSAERIAMMKEQAVVVSVSRKETVDIAALLSRAYIHPNFYVCLDIDVDQMVRDMYRSVENVYITPHIAGGTVASRIRMFTEVAVNIANQIK